MNAAMGHSMMGAEMGGSMLLNMVVSFLIVLLVAWAVQRVGKSGFDRTEDSTVEILKKRYARGEINKAEFEEKKRDIS